MLGASSTGITTTPALVELLISPSLTSVHPMHKLFDQDQFAKAFHPLKMSTQIARL